MTTPLVLTEAEKLTALVYGDTFALYDKDAFEEFMRPLQQRLRVNEIDTRLFEGKRCLDAGCGGGRGSILMAQSGAREVIGIDLSARNVESCRRRAAQMGLDNLTFQQHSLAAIPFEDESFDMVWCNGVLQHAAQPDESLREIARVLKTGGWMWLYVYGSGGTYWYVIDWIRKTLEGVDPKECIWQLRLMEMPVRRIAEWIDDWFTTYLRRYTRDDVTRRLDELGFVETTPRDRGTVYDTSQRRIDAASREREHMGQGDVRHFCRKAGRPRGHEHALPDPPGGLGSPYVDPQAVTQFAEPLGRLSARLDAIERKKGHEIAAYRILVCRSVHAKVRSLLETSARFDEQGLHDHLAGLNALLSEFAH